MIIPASIVFEHPSGAVLIHGNADAPQYVNDHTKVSLTITAFNLPEDYHAMAPFARRLRIDLRDLGSMPPDDLEWTRREALRAAAAIADDLASGLSALCVCQAGYNRSGLVCALALVKIGMKPEQAIQTLRTRRSENVLGNALFEAMVLGKA